MWEEDGWEPPMGGAPHFSLPGVTVPVRDAKCQGRHPQSRRWENTLCSPYNLLERIGHQFAAISGQPDQTLLHSKKPPLHQGKVSVGGGLCPAALSFTPDAVMGMQYLTLYQEQPYRGLAHSSSRL